MRFLAVLKWQQSLRGTKVAILHNSNALFDFAPRKRIIFLQEELRSLANAAIAVSLHILATTWHSLIDAPANVLRLNSSRQLFVTCQAAHSMLDCKVCLKTRVARFAGPSRLFANDAAQLQIRIAKKSLPQPCSVVQEGHFIDFEHAVS